MKTKFNSLVTAVAMVAAVLAIAPQVQARGHGGGMRMSASRGMSSHHFANSGSRQSARPQRHGADDPAGHNAGDDRGRHHRRHHHHHGAGHP
jgi:hypothetical protein